MSSKKRLGRGLEALLSGESIEIISDKLEDDQLEEEKVISETITSDKLKIDKNIVLKALEEGKKNPRVVVWSPRSSVALRILKKTIPEFSISNEASKLLEEAIKEKYPEIWKVVKDIV